MLPHVMNMAPGAVDVSFQYVEARIGSLQERVAGLEQIIYSDEDADLRDVGESDREPVDVDSDTSSDDESELLFRSQQSAQLKRSATARKREAAKKALKKKPAARQKAMIVKAKKPAAMKKPASTRKKALAVACTAATETPTSLCQCRRCLEQTLPSEPAGDPYADEAVSRSRADISEAADDGPDTLPSERALATIFANKVAARAHAGNMRPPTREQIIATASNIDLFKGRPERIDRLVNALAAATQGTIGESPGAP